MPLPSADSPGRKAKWFRRKRTAAILLAFVLFVLIVSGAAAFSLYAAKSKEPSFTVVKEYYDYYDGENTYCVVIEYTGASSEDIEERNWFLRETYYEYFEECEAILIAYYPENTFSENMELLETADYYVFFYLPVIYEE